MTLTNWYELGKEEKTEGNDRDSAEYSAVMNGADDIDIQWFYLGFDGEEKPVKSVGWRYGEFTEWGSSRNFSKDINEKGISMMECTTVKGEKLVPETRMFELFAKGVKKVYYVKGYTSTDIYGGDGEPLMLMAEHMTKKEYNEVVGI